MSFISLHNQTYYSILDSLVSPKKLLERAKELNQPAVAITDHATLAAAWEAYKASKDVGVKLIIGCEFYFVDDLSVKDQKFRHIILLAKNETGYKNILTLNRRGFDSGFSSSKKNFSVIDWDILSSYKEGTICLTACGSGIISQLLMTRKTKEAEEAVLKLKELFQDDLGLEILANNMKRSSNFFSEEIEQAFINRQLINLGKKHNIKVVPACNTHYILKEDHDVHDVLLSVGSHQPVYSNFRLRYTTDDFYLKSYDEIKSFFSRNYGDEYVEELCANTVYFADKCEDPNWISPSYSNPSGKELPIFPVKDEPDYNEFKTWLANQSDEVKNLTEDRAFLRFKVFSIFEEKKKTEIPKSKHKEYEDRIYRELDVFETLDISSYMLITADFLNFARKNNIPVGPGRGCLSGDTMVLTENGYAQLSDIKIGDKVYSHTGNLRPVTNTFKFNVENEELLKIKSTNSFKDLIMTKDHKVLTTNSSLSKPAWVQAKDVVQNKDYLYTPILNRDVLNPSKVDLQKYANFVGEYYEYKSPIKSKISIRAVSKNTNINFESVRSFKHTKNISESYKEKITNYIVSKGYSLDDFFNRKAFKVNKVNRFIDQDEDFYYFLGRWVGDGSYHSKKGISIVFNSKDEIGISKIYNYLTKLGFSVCKEDRINNNTLLTVSTPVIYNLFKSLFPFYKKCYTKHMPIGFRSLPSNLLKALLLGIVDSDGYINKNGMEVITTTSKRLAFEIKESLNYLNLPCTSYYREDVKRYDVPSAPNYRLHFSGIKSKLKSNLVNDDGFYHKISKIQKTNVQYVYDITVDKDNSYLTTNGIVHNSAGGSYIAYLLNIHCADSIKYNLVFERFHNKLKKACSDIDNDISKEHRHKVIEYVKNKYGVDYVASVSNYNTITPKVYARDIARALELGGSKDEAVDVGNLIAGIIPEDCKSIKSAKEKIPLFSENLKKYPEYEKYMQIDGLIRDASTHAAGIVIGKRPLVGLVPLRKDKDGSVTLEYNKDYAEENGLVKIDFLGLSTLDLIEDIISMIKSNGKPFNNEHLDYDANCPKTYKLISDGDLLGVFQFGTSAGTIEICKKYKPKKLEDLAIITTLARPGSKDIRDEFILTKDKKKEISVSHPILEKSLKGTYGYLIFDETILNLAKDVAGWDLGEADSLRKLVKDKGKNPEKDKKIRQSFIDSAVNKNGVEENIAIKVWDDIIAPCGSYVFNLSHSILYSMISYQTAYLKAHYPVEFLMCSLIAETRSNKQNTDIKIEKLKNELRRHNVQISPPDINNSDISYKFHNGKLLTGFEAIAQVGDEAIVNILEKRPFKSFNDFMTRIDSHHVRSNTIQALTASGALDCFNLSRKQMFLYCSDYRKKLQVWLKKHDASEEFIYPWEDAKDWNVQELYGLENKFMGEGFACKPYMAYGNFFSTNNTAFSLINKAKDKTKFQSIKGILRDLFEFKIKKETSKFYGQTMVKAVIEDVYGDHLSLTIFPDRWETLNKTISLINKKVKFEPGIAIHIGGTLNIFEDQPSVILDSLYNVAGVPQGPDKESLKHKKVSLRITNKTKKQSSLFEDIEDELYEEGLLEDDEKDN